MHPHHMEIRLNIPLIWGGSCGRTGEAFESPSVRPTGRRAESPTENDGDCYGGSPKSAERPRPTRQRVEEVRGDG
jgi:hypothetical protein